MEEENKEMQRKEGKFSYEELNNIATNLSSEVDYLRRALQEASMNNMFKRLDYLFRVVEHMDKFDSDFAIACIEEIQALMTIPRHTDENPE